MVKVFISYRRSESLQDSERICDYLSSHLSAANVFKDVHTISKGSAFQTVIRKALSTTDAVLVLIGPRWLNLRLGSGLRRLEDPSDYVRLELQMALERHPNCLIIPVLIDNTPMPQENQMPDGLQLLASFTPAVVRTNAYFLRDMQAIVERIQVYCGEGASPLDHPRTGSL